MNLTFQGYKLVHSSCSRTSISLVTLMVNAYIIGSITRRYLSSFSMIFKENHTGLQDEHTHDYLCRHHHLVLFHFYGPKFHIKPNLITSTLHRMSAVKNAHPGGSGVRLSLYFPSHGWGIQVLHAPILSQSSGERGPVQSFDQWR